ncbi:hypothetical protein BDP81DRAFT_476582 [Colletotrichum phormii]|uniref:Uncharacterized protein n=1 Tax=Colletotrichum phormii TaxID=359342 RepID=A0AAJ0EA03_9PEZI|nr:uncharacterized protein BDP81DRAFT_476582 [Colletotrichum phormii]KAK1622218.1 hypothetical protein BDP81DRAFT_476582 [Colletotrichum phormii]
MSMQTATENESLFGSETYQWVLRLFSVGRGQLSQHSQPWVFYVLGTNPVSFNNEEKNKLNLRMRAKKYSHYPGVEIFSRSPGICGQILSSWQANVPRNNSSAPPHRVLSRREDGVLTKTIPISIMPSRSDGAELPNFTLFAHDKSHESCSLKMNRWTIEPHAKKEEVNALAIYQSLRLKPSNSQQ